MLDYKEKREFRGGDAVSPIPSYFSSRASLFSLRDAAAAPPPQDYFLYLALAAVSATWMYPRVIGSRSQKLTNAAYVRAKARVCAAAQNSRVKRQAAREIDMQMK